MKTLKFFDRFQCLEKLNVITMDEIESKWNGVNSQFRYPLSHISIFLDTFQSLHSISNFQQYLGVGMGGGISKFES